MYTVCQEYLNWYLNNRKIWVKEIAPAILETKEQLLAFQLFYNSPDEAYKGKMVQQLLERKDLVAMYPTLLKKVE